MIFGDIVLHIDNMITKKELANFMQSSSNEFKPTLYSRVNVKEYCEKLMAKASLFVARQRGKVIGVIAFYCNDRVQFQANLSYLFVARENRGVSIGTMLLRKALLYCKESGMKSMKVETWKDNKAIALYRKLGFKQVSVTKRHGVSRIIMVTQFEGIENCKRSL